MNSPVKINCKEGVWFKFISWEFLVLAQIFFWAYQRKGFIPTVTSACDGKHCEDSFHYQGFGWDWRIWGLDDPKTPQNEILEVVEEIRKEAREVSKRYDIIYGDKDHLDHIHTEYDYLKKI